MGQGDQIRRDPAGLNRPSGGANSAAQRRSTAPLRYALPGANYGAEGHVPEWLWSGLQNRLPRFNSGRGLHLQI